MDTNILISDLLQELLKKVEAAGYSQLTIWRNIYPDVRAFELYAQRQGETYYSNELLQKFKTDVIGRFSKGEIGSRSKRSLLYNAERIRQFHDIGQVNLPAKDRGTKYVLCGNYQQLHDEFIASLDKKPKATSDISWSVHRYLYYMQNKGITSLADASVDDARQFIIEMASSMKMSSVKNIVIYLKQFQLYLLSNHIPSPNCMALFSTRIYREYPIYDYVHDEELDLIIHQIDTSTPKGKRDLAIILLGAVMGIRAGDIIHLKLSDFDWNSLELRFVQAKTGTPIVLPLVEPAASAVKDYIHNGRPDQDYPEVFLRVVAPITAIESATAIQYMFKQYALKAGIERRPGDGKNFHGLRRRLGRNMLLNNVPATTIAQVLGHKTYDSTKQYMAIDNEHLKTCALDFRHVPVEREVLNG